MAPSAFTMSGRRQPVQHVKCTCAWRARRGQVTVTMLHGPTLCRQWPRRNLKSGVCSSCTSFHQRLARSPRTVAPIRLRGVEVVLSLQILHASNALNGRHVAAEELLHPHGGTQSGWQTESTRRPINDHLRLPSESSEGTHMARIYWDFVNCNNRLTEAIFRERRSFEHSQKLVGCCHGATRVRPGIGFAVSEKLRAGAFGCGLLCS